MKHTYTVVFVCLFSFCYGQSNPQRVQLVKLSPAQSTLNQTSKTSVPNTDSLAGITAQHCQSVIDAIDSKVAYIQSDPEEHAKALASGWYELMAKNRRDWVADRDELIRRENLTK